MAIRSTSSTFQLDEHYNDVKHPQPLRVSTQFTQTSTHTQITFFIAHSKVEFSWNLMKMRGNFPTDHSMRVLVNMTFINKNCNFYFYKDNIWKKLQFHWSNFSHRTIYLYIHILSFFNTLMHTWIDYTNTAT